MNSGLVSFTADGFDCGYGYHRKSIKKGKWIYCLYECDGPPCTIDDLNNAWKLFRDDVHKQCTKKYKGNEAKAKTVEINFLRKTIDCTKEQFQNTISYNSETGIWE